LAGGYGRTEEKGIGGSGFAKGGSPETSLYFEANMLIVMAPFSRASQIGSESCLVTGALGSLWDGAADESGALKAAAYGCDN
jgi:hypothetical protein